jgi:hypothetical protein
LAVLACNWKARPQSAARVIGTIFERIVFGLPGGNWLDQSNARIMFWANARSSVKTFTFGVVFELETGHDLTDLGTWFVVPEEKWPQVAGPRGMAKKPEPPKPIVWGHL